MRASLSGSTRKRVPELLVTDVTALPWAFTHASSALGPPPPHPPPITTYFSWPLYEWEPGHGRGVVLAAEAADRGDRLAGGDDDRPGRLRAGDGDEVLRRALVLQQVGRQRRVGRLAATEATATPGPRAPTGP